MIQVGVYGANGRMGRALIQACQQSDEVQLHSAIVRQGSSLTGCDAGELGGTGKSGLALVNVPEPDCDVMIDFTLPEGLSRHLDWCVEHNVAMVVGTTGLNQEQMDRLNNAARSIPVVFAANYSVGVNLLIKLTQQAAKVLGDSADIEIIETHHRYKKDAPSGTALALGQAVADTLQVDLKQQAVYGREGETGERPAGQIGFSTVRGGDVVGDHTVLLADLGERLELTHKASSRLTFAKGALRAAKWLKGKQNGLYSMLDVLDLVD